MMGKIIQLFRKYSIAFLVVVIILVALSGRKNGVDEKNIDGKKGLIPTRVAEERYGQSGEDEETSKISDEAYEKSLRDYPLWEKMPFEGRGFKISHYSSPLTVVVYPMGLDKELVENEVRQWIKDNGGDEIRHKIEWR